MYTIQYLLDNSHLPGPRGNLTLLYDFSRNASEEQIEKCLEYIKPDVSNSPEEFAAMCGVLSYSLYHRSDLPRVISFLKEKANHGSWRIREAAAMAIQEISEDRLQEVIGALRPLIEGSMLERRAVVAGLCEPKLLNEKSTNREILFLLGELTRPFSHDGKLDEESTALRKALGYGWSVVISHEPEEGKSAFEQLLALPGKHIRWIIRENLKKNRLIKLDSPWVTSCLAQIG